MLSFKINKKAGSVGSAPVQAPKTLPQASKKAFNDEEEPDFIDGLDGTNIVSRKQKKPEKKELVIPLITKNEWQIDAKREKHGERDHKRKVKAEKDGPKSDKTLEATEKAAGEEEGDSLKQQAIKELLEGASSGNSTDKKSDSRSIPILFQNRVSEGYEEEDNMDVSLRPDQATLEDYEEIPIDQFGLAMLRGMGWKEDEGIGLRNKKVVDMAEPKIRPKGMGLGAESAHKNKDVTPKNLSSTDNEKEDLTLKIGGFALINRGSKKGYYGQIESFDEDNNRVILRLAISGKMEAVSKFYIDVVAAKEYKKSSKVINSEKYEEYKSRQDNGESGQETFKEERDLSRGSRSSSRSNDDEKDYRSRSRRKNRDGDDEDEYKNDSKRTAHRRNDRDRSSKSSKRDRKDRHDKKYEDRVRNSSSNRNDDYYKRSSRNGDKRSDSHGRSEDYYRDRKHGRSSKSYRE